MRLTTNDAPALFKGESDVLDGPVPPGQYLVTITEFGVQLAYRESPFETWSAPIVMQDVTR